MTRPDPNAEAQAAAKQTRPGRFSLAGLFQPAKAGQAEPAEPVWRVSREQGRGQGQAKGPKVRPALPVLLAA